MDSKRILRIFLGLCMAILIIYIITSIRGKSKQSAGYADDFAADAQGMDFTKVGEDNKPLLQIKSEESQKGEGDRVYMKKITANIFKKGRRNKDFKVAGDKGFVENEFHNFFIEGNATITSKDFKIASPDFTLLDQAELSTKQIVNYNTATLQGKAIEGMLFFLKINTLKFFKSSGTYRRDERDFDYRADVLWFIDEQKMLVMEKDAVIRDDRSIMRSDWVTLQFTEDMKHIKESSSQKKSYLFIEDKEKKQIREIKSENIRSRYDENGKMTQLTVIKNANVLLREPGNQTTIASDTIDMFFDPATGNAKNVTIPLRGVVENSGDNTFRVAADSIFIDYNDKGALRLCKGSGKTRFHIQEYTGKTEELLYKIRENIIEMDGNNSQLINKNNTFYSTQFSVHTQKKIMSTKSGVKSVIQLAKDNVIFSKESIFINARNLSIMDREKKFIYSGNVNLNQGDVVMDTNVLDISEENNIVASGGVSLSFKNGDKDVSIKGKTVIFDSRKRLIDIQDNAAMKNGENVLRAAHIEIRFNDKGDITTILAKKDINFIKDDLNGYSQRVQWNFQKDEMILRGSPRIIKKGGGRTVGKILSIDLKTGKITILSGDSDRTETIIQ